jgi:Tc5 transposase DNA-binding domain
MIKAKALELSSNPDKFKASKGWTDKFVKKFNLRKRVVTRL